MTETRHNPIVRLLPSLTDFAFLMPVVFLFARMGGAQGLLNDGDTGWHLRTGEWILANGRVPHQDIFSFTKAGQPWFAWEWLWDLVFAFLHQHAGLTGVVLASMLIICFTSVLLFRLVMRRCGDALISIAVAFLAAAGSALHWLARPHLVTTLFVVVFCTVLERMRERQDGGGTLGVRWTVLLAAMTVLWTNLHGGFFVGIALVLAYGAGELLRAATGENDGERRAAFLRSRPYLVATAVCATVTLCNPYGYELHLHIYRYLRDPDLFAYVEEFMALTPDHPGSLYFELALLVGAAAAFWSICRRRLADAILIVMWAHWSYISARNIPLFMTISAPTIARAVRDWGGMLGRKSQGGWLTCAVRKVAQISGEITEMERIPRLHVASVAAILLIAAVLWAPVPPKSFNTRFNPELFPERAVTELVKTGPVDRIFTHDQWGDYLIYTLYPRIRVFTDGRSDFYGAEFSRDWRNIVRARYQWAELLDRYAIDAVLLPTGTPVVSAMKESGRWRVVYDDGRAIAFRSASADKASVVRTNGGWNRDREVTKPQQQPCDRTITTQS